MNDSSASATMPFGPPRRPHTTENQVPAWVRRIPPLAGALTIALGLVVLYGWHGGHSTLTGKLGSQPPMKVNTAVAFLLTGLCLPLSTRNSRAVRWAGGALSVVVVAFGFLTLIEWSIDRSFIDNVIRVGSRISGDNGRPALQTATAFMLIGLSLAIHTLTDAERGAAIWLERIATLGSVFVVGSIEVGYLYGTNALKALHRGAGVSPFTAVGLLALLLALLALDADKVPLSWLWRTSPSGVMLRWLLPTITVVEPLLGYLIIFGERRDWYDGRFAIAVLIGATLLVFVVVASLLARQLDELDQQRRTAQSVIEATYANTPNPMALRDTSGRYLLVNQAVADTLGVRAEDMRGRTMDSFYPPELAETFVAEDRRIAESRTVLDVERAIVNAEGKEQWFHLTRFPVLDEDDSVIGVGSVAVDITDRAVAQREASELAERLLTLMESAPDATAVVDARGVITFVNARFVALLGYEVDEIVGQAVEVLVPDDVKPRHAGIRQKFLEAPSNRMVGVGGDVHARHRDGTLIPVEISLGPVDTTDGIVTTVSIRDITERKAAERALAAAVGMFRNSFEDAPIGKALVSPDGILEQVNLALANIIGEDRLNLVGRPLADLVHPNDREELTSAMADMAMPGSTGRMQLEVQLEGGSAQSVDVEIRATLLRDETEAPVRYIVQVMDVTERLRYQEQLQFMAEHDPLTGLHNRRRFDAELTEHLDRCRRYGAEGALLALDIDHFKQVNDTLGHNAGDELIISVANTLTSRLRTSDVVARLGGDEFAVILPRANLNEATDVADAICSAIRSDSSLLSGVTKRITTSIGITMFDSTPLDDLTAQEVMIQADVALYDAKEAGRDRFAFYVEPDQRTSRTRARLGWSDRIEKALDENRFTLVAQPILDLRTDDIHQYELLIRMIDEQGEIIPPAAFLYIAERQGLITRIDEWVFHQAADLLERRPDLSIEVNLSAHSLGSKQLLGAMSERLAERRFDPSRIIFEVTETAAVANIGQAQAFARHLHELGCRFALDDFGAGFGSFYYLKHLPFDYVKIDGEFVQHAASGRIDQLVITALVRVAHGLDKKTIAEFVTNDKTKDLVRNLGVDYAQGHAVGHPMPAAHLLTGALS